VVNAECTLELDELRQFLMPRIAFYKIPARLEIVDSLPVTSMGKVRRNILRDQILGSPGGSPPIDVTEGERRADHHP
jgi:acyl-CoA synthetase (AMP-forming)/AMP-acid ligase II